MSFPLNTGGQFLWVLLLSECAHGRSGQSGAVRLPRLQLLTVLLGQRTGNAHSVLQMMALSEVRELFFFIFSAAIMS